MILSKSLVFCSFALLLAINVSCVAAAGRSSLAAASKGHIHIQHQNKANHASADILADFGQPLSVSSSPVEAAAAGPAAVAVPAVKANIKRIFFKNNCSCSEGSSAPYPLVALSYKPVQSADFYNIGYWSVTGCDAKYLVATTEGKHDVIDIKYSTVSTKNPAGILKSAEETSLWSDLLF